MNNFNIRNRKEIQKLAILTLNGYFNYGNRFQNYALQQTLLNYSNHVDTLLISKNFKIDIKSKNDNPSLLIRIKRYNILELLKKNLSFVLQKTIGRKVIKKRKNLRHNAFVSFSKAYLNEIDLGITPQSIPDGLGTRYDFFVVGSDQVWNPTFPEFSELFFLTFVPKHKRVAYAPSFGLSELPEEVKDNFSTWLSSMEYLSVREESGESIIRNLTGRDVPVVLDPTMLLTKEEWLRVSTPLKTVPKKPYILTYFLGTLDAKRGKEIKLFAKKNSLMIIQINELTSKYYTTGPGELISLINQATLILTDSFHGTVFSILFEKPFLTYKRVGRDDMYSRIETLFSLLHLENRENMRLSDPNLCEIDYHEVKQLLEIERNKAFDYLSTCFNSNKYELI